MYGVAGADVSSKRANVAHGAWRMEDDGYVVRCARALYSHVIAHVNPVRFN